MKKKLVLGTANLIDNYGILKNSLDEKNFLECLKKLNNKNYNYIETSLNYKNSYKILKNKNFTKFNITLKTNLLVNEILKIKNLFKNKKQKKLYCVMLHDPNKLLLRKKKEVYKSLVDLKKENICSNIGISFYDFSHIKKILSKYNFDIIQFPLNLFDQRILESKYKKIIFKNKTIIQVRSIFLQGLLLNKKHKFSDTKEFKNYYNWVKKSGKESIYHCTNFIRGINLVNQIIVGVNSSNQLSKLINTIKLKRINFDYSIFKCKNKKIINPYLRK